MGSDTTDEIAEIMDRARRWPTQVRIAPASRILGSLEGPIPALSARPGRRRRRHVPGGRPAADGSGMPADPRRGAVAEVRRVNVMLDLNVLPDVLLAREPLFADARALWDAHNRGIITGHVAAHGLTNLFYVLRRVVGTEPARPHRRPVPPPDLRDRPGRPARA